MSWNLHYDPYLKTRIVEKVFGLKVSSFRSSAVLVAPIWVEFKALWFFKSTLHFYLLSACFLLWEFDFLTLDHSNNIGYCTLAKLAKSLLLLKHLAWLKDLYTRMSYSLTINLSNYRWCRLDYRPNSNYQHRSRFNYFLNLRKVYQHLITSLA